MHHSTIFTWQTVATALTIAAARPQDCFLSAVINDMSHDEVIAPFVKAFDSQAAGGCPSVPPSV